MQSCYTTRVDRSNLAAIARNYDGFECGRHGDGPIIGSVKVPTLARLIPLRYRSEWRDRPAHFC